MMNPLVWAGRDGTLALYVECGVDVYLVCATRGEVGEMDEKYLQGFETTIIVTAIIRVTKTVSLMRSS